MPPLEQNSEEENWLTNVIPPGNETILFSDSNSANDGLRELSRTSSIIHINNLFNGMVQVTHQPHLSPSTPISVQSVRLRQGTADRFYPQQSITSLGFSSFSAVPPLGDSIDKDAYSRLIKAADKIENGKNTRAQQMNQLRGRREGQYIKMLRNDKRRNMTFIEIVGSEIPIRLTDFGWGKAKQILDTIRMTEVEIKDGRHILHCVGDCKLPKVPYEFAYFCNNHIYCSEHVPDLKLCDVCFDLHPKTKTVKSYDEKVLNVCIDCIRRFVGRGCRTCDGSITIEYIQTHMCGKCVDRNRHNGPYHGFSKNLKWTGHGEGEVVHSSRIYSAEVEALSPFIDHPSQLYGILPTEVGIATDGSVTANDGRAYGFELQTPRLSGKRGEELIQRICSAAKTVEAHVNESCGMHIHIDGKGLIPQNRKEYPASLIQLWKAYLVFEDVLMSLVPYSRRNNDFCRRLTEAFQVNELDTIENMVDVEKMWYKARTTHDIRNAKGQHYSATRYFGVNFHCLLNDGHFEIRFHPGTLNAKKILEWANLHVLITDAAVNLSFTSDFLREAQATYHMQEKAALLFDHIGMSKSSKEFYLSRQRKFADKKNRDDETKRNGESHRGNLLTADANDNGF